MSLSRNSGCSKTIDEQKHIKLSENSMGSWANGCIIKRIRLSTRVCLTWANQWVGKETEKVGKNHGQSWGHWRFNVKWININCALRSSYAYFCDRNKQYEDKKLWMPQLARNCMESFSWALSNGTGQEFGFTLGKKMAGSGVETDDQAVCSNA